jgi:hypothetical protein
MNLLSFQEQINLILQDVEDLNTENLIGKEPLVETMRLSLEEISRKKKELESIFYSIFAISSQVDDKLNIGGKNFDILRTSYHLFVGKSARGTLPSNCNNSLQAGSNGTIIHVISNFHIYQCKKRNENHLEPNEKASTSSDVGSTDASSFLKISRTNLILK